MAIPLILVIVALATVDAATLRKESTAKAIAPGAAVPTPSTFPPHLEESPSTASVTSKTSSSVAAAQAQTSHPPPLAQGRKSLKERKPSSKKRSPNHALLTKFGLSRWEGEEARMGAAYTAESWKDAVGAGEDHSSYPRIPVKVKKGGGGKRRSSEEGESDMYYVRLPPIHQYYSPFLHGHPDAEEETPARYGATNRKHHRQGVEEEVSTASARAGDNAPDGHSLVINIRPLPASAPFDHDASATSHHSQHRHHAVRRLPLSFRTNGKPGPVYHWNLPVLRGEEEGKRGWKKVYGTKSGATQSTHSIAHKSHPKSKPTEESPTPSPPPSSTTTEFPYIESDVFHVVKTVRGRVHPMAVPPQRPRVPGGHHRKPYHRKPLSSHPATAFPVVSYYSRKGSKGEPTATGSRDEHQHTAVQKSFFQGNGKPHGFYVINGSKKYYHRLLP